MSETFNVAFSSIDSLCLIKGFIFLFIDFISLSLFSESVSSDLFDELADFFVV